MRHHNDTIHELRIQKMHEFQEEENYLWDRGYGRYRGMGSHPDREYVPLDKPYKEGYFLTLIPFEPMMKTIPEDKEAHLRKVWEYFVTEFVSMEKRPSWKKHWDVVDDIIHFPKKNKRDTEDRIGHMFAWYQAVKDKNGAFNPHSYFKDEHKDFFNKELRPYMELVELDYINWKGDREKIHFFTLEKKWRKFFQFRRYDRIITHKLVLDGTKISREHYLNEKLYYQYGNSTGLKWNYDEKTTTNNDRWDSGLQRKRANEYWRIDKRDIDNGDY
jgi:hypothetical protein